MCFHLVGCIGRHCRMLFITACHQWGADSKVDVGRNLHHWLPCVMKYCWGTLFVKQVLLKSRIVGIGHVFKGIAATVQNITCGNHFCQNRYICWQKVLDAVHGEPEVVC